MCEHRYRREGVLVELSMDDAKCFVSECRRPDLSKISRSESLLYFHASPVFI